MPAYVTVDEPRIYPGDEEVNFSEEHCPSCGHECFSRSCWSCGGEGGHDGYEEDPLWYDPGDIIPCDACRGEGHHHWCPRCGWDLLRPAEQNLPEYRGMAIARPL
jgi:hypothetical protein